MVEVTLYDIGYSPVRGLERYYHDVSDFFRQILVSYCEIDFGGWLREGLLLGVSLIEAGVIVPCSLFGYSWVDYFGVLHSPRASLPAGEIGVNRPSFY